MLFADILNAGGSFDTVEKGREIQATYWDFCEHFDLRTQLCAKECGLWSFDVTSDGKGKKMGFDVTNVAFGAGQ